MASFIVVIVPFFVDGMPVLAFYPAPKPLVLIISVADDIDYREIEMDASSALLMTLGAAALLISWVLLLITSFNEDYAWGLFSLLLPPAGYTYGLFRLDKARQSILLAVLGWALIYLGW